MSIYYRYKQILLLVLLINKGFSQTDSLVLTISENDSIIFTSYPKQLHFYARNIQGDDCTFEITGIKTESTDDVLLEIYKDGEILSDYLLSDNSFSLTTTIDAGLYLYDLLFYLPDGNGGWSQLYNIEDVVCGDAYLITGQSNAVAWVYGDGNEMANTFVRSAGLAINESDMNINPEFGIGNVTSPDSNAYIGVLGLVMANEIVNSQGIPVFILNTAVGWTNIEEHQRDDSNPYDISTIYGNTLWHTRAVELQDKIRAIIWYQGERDAYTPYGDYLDLMTQLSDDWLEDYPNIEGIYNFQPRRCCNWHLDFPPMLEVHRQLPDLLPMVKGNMSSTAIESYDAWHFNLAGYTSLGVNVARLVKRDIYLHDFDHNIEAPNPKIIRWIDADKIGIDFGESGEGLTFEQGAEEYLSLSDSTVNYNLDIDDSMITITTDCLDDIDWISFNHDYQTNGPWLINNLGIGSFSWLELPVHPSRPLYVTENGSDENGCGSSTNPVRTIQKAIELADEADTIFVSEGIYNGPINFLGKNIIIKGEDNETTLIDGQGETICVEISTGEDSTATLENFTITNGASNTVGGGIYCSNSSIKLKNLIIRNNSTNANGGGIFIDNSSFVKLENVLVDSNTAYTNGGGIAISDNSTLNIINSNIARNSTNINGGGIAISDNSTLNIINSSITGNSTNINGGGIVILGNSNSTIESCYVGGNITVGNGGGVAIAYNSTANIIGSNIHANSAHTGAGNGGGVAILYSSSINIIDSDIIDNFSQNDGGGIILFDHSTGTIENSNIATNHSNNNGGGVLIFDYSTGTIENTTITSNTALNSGGGIYFKNENSQNILYVIESSIQGNATTSWNGFTNSGVSGGGMCIISEMDENPDVIITNVIIAENTSSNGGAISVEPAKIKINSSIINENNTTLTQNYSGTINLLYDSTIELFNVTSVNNTNNQNCLISCSGSNSSENGPDIIIKNSILWEPLGAIIYFSEENSVPGYIGIASSNINGGQSSIITNDNALLNWGSGNMDANPLFVDPINNDFQLMDNSPCLGVGLFNPVDMDLIGHPRPDPYESKPDMGAYENIYGLYGDVTMNGDVSSLDASLVLKHVVGLDTLDALERFYGDVTQNGEISALDASYILQYVVGLLDYLPYVPPEGLSTTGDITINNIDAIPGMTIEIPIQVSNDENIYSFKGILNYDPTVLLMDTILTGNYFNNFMLLSNAISEGQVYIGGSGDVPNQDANQIAVAVFSVLETFNDYTRISITDLILNDNEPIPLAASMTISHLLGISGELPHTFALHQNYPNPFNPITVLRYDLPEEEFVTVTIYDIAGGIVKNLVSDNKKAGYHSTHWDATNNRGRNVSAGMYIYTINAGKYRSSKKMILLK